MATLPPLQSSPLLPPLHTSGNNRQPPKPMTMAASQSSYDIKKADALHLPLSAFVCSLFLPLRTPHCEEVHHARYNYTTFYYL